MSTEPGPKQWRDAIQSRRGSEDSRFWRQTVANQRQQIPFRKGGGPDWKAYVEMRRKLSGPDGRSRSKGHPSGKKKGGRRLGRTLPKINLHTAQYRERVMALHHTKKSGSEGKERTSSLEQSRVVKKPVENVVIPQTLKPVQGLAKSDGPTKPPELKSQVVR